MITASRKPPSKGTVVCDGQYQWLPHRFALTLRLGTKLVARFCFPGLQLDAPPTRLTTPLRMPDWRRLPAGTDVATIEALPQGDRVRRLSVSRAGILRDHHADEVRPTNHPRPAPISPSRTAPGV